MGPPGHRSPQHSGVKARYDAKAELYASALAAYREKPWLKRTFDAYDAAKREFEQAEKELLEFERLYPANKRRVTI